MANDIYQFDYMKKKNIKGNVDRSIYHICQFNSVVDLTI